MRFFVVDTSLAIVDDHGLDAFCFNPESGSWGQTNGPDMEDDGSEISAEGFIKALQKEGLPLPPPFKND